jgi:hypothetical protein
MTSQSLAAIEMLGRTGAIDFQMRYSDDEYPTIWIAASSWMRHINDQNLRLYETASALNPEQAIFRLCSQVMDGGECTHCHRPTGFDEEHLDMPMSEIVCWYLYDPELKKFRRSCEDGVTVNDLLEGP